MSRGVAWRGALAPIALALLAALAGCPGPEQPLQRADAPAPRVIVVSPAVAGMICALGAEAHLVGVSKFCTQPALADVPRIGGLLDPNLEALDALEPDVVFWQGKSDRLVDLAALRGFDLRPVEIESIADVYGMFGELGALLDRDERAAVEVARIKAALAAAAEGHTDPKPRVLLIYDRSAGELGQLASAGRGTFLSELLEAAGGVNCLDEVAVGSWPLLAPEVPFDERPDVILELSSRALSAAEAQRLRADWEGFDDIPAVANGRVAVVCGEDLLLPGPRIDHTVGLFARALAGETLVGVDEGEATAADEAGE